MKRYTLISVIVALFVSVASFAQAPDILWTKTFGGSDWDWAESVQQTADGGFIVAGGTETYGAGGGDVYLIKTFASGNVEWTKTFGGSDWETSLSVQQTADGGYIVAGETYSYGAGDGDVYLIKTDADGDTVWTKTFGGSGYDCGWGVQQTTDYGYIIAGETYSYGAGEADVYLIKTNADGYTMWTKTFGGSDYDIGYSVQQTADFGYIIAGITYSYGAGPIDVWLIKTDANGDTMWTKTLGGSGSDIGYSVRQTTDGGYIVTGTTNSYGAGSYDIWLIKTDALGNYSWDNTFGGIGWDIGWNVQQTADGGYVVAGQAGSGYQGSKDAWLIKTYADGSEEWICTFCGSGIDIFASVQQTPDGGYIVAGQTSSYGAGGTDVWLLKVGFRGSLAGSISPAFSGLIVDLYQNGQLVDFSLTDNGAYSSPNLEPGNYSVQLVEPLGFTADENPKLVIVPSGETATADFTLTSIVTTNTARSHGYWKHQINANGNTDFTPTEMLNLAQEIFDHFYGNPINPIQVDGVTYVADPAQALGISDLQAMMNIFQGGSTLYERACQRYLTLLLNVVSDKVGQTTIASAEGATHSQAVVYIYDLLTEPDTNYDLAKNIAETLNSGQMVTNGVIPLSTPNIIFGEGAKVLSTLPTEFSFGAYPNPFNPETTLRFHLPEASDVNLSIYSINGSLVRNLIDGRREAGMHEVSFDGAGLASGIYVYQLKAGQHIVCGKMALLK